MYKISIESNFLNDFLFLEGPEGFERKTSTIVKSYTGGQTAVENMRMVGR
jgi:hypothetical protein